MSCLQVHFLLNNNCHFHSNAIGLLQNHSQLQIVFNKSWYPSMCENALIFNVNQFNFSMAGCMLGLSFIKGLTLQDCDDCCSYNQQQFWCSMTKDALWQTWLKCSGIFGRNCIRVESHKHYTEITVGLHWQELHWRVQQALWKNLTSLDWPVNVIFTIEVKKTKRSCFCFVIEVSKHPTRTSFPLGPYVVFRCGIFWLIYHFSSSNIAQPLF